MNSSPKLLVSALKGQAGRRPPFWFMRQAGRYLPEYKELRAKAGSFLDFCYNPAMASEATLQPIRRFGMDGAIVFSDILIVPHAMGVEVRFEEKRGPLLATVTDESGLDRLSFQQEKLSPVYEALELTRKALPEETALIGFAGAPWTLACYVIHGSGSRDFQDVRIAAARHPAFFSRLIDLLTDAVARHLIKQAEAGAEVVQIFDSWSGVLSEQEFERWVIAPTRKIVSAFRKKHPHIPVIGFPRLSGAKYLDYVRSTGVDAVNFDGSVSLSFAKDCLSPLAVLQGNLDPVLLAEDKNATLKQAATILTHLGDKSFVFNLGHGILPHTPVAHMQALCDYLRNV